MNQISKSILVTSALGIVLSTFTGAHAQYTTSSQPSTDSLTVQSNQAGLSTKPSDLAVRDLRVTGELSPAPLANGSKLPKKMQMKVRATLVNVGPWPTPGCKVRMTNTGDSTIHTVVVPGLPAGGTFQVTFPTPTLVCGPVGTQGLLQVEVNFDAGLSPYGRFFPELNYSNNIGKFSYLST